MVANAGFNRQRCNWREYLVKILRRASFFFVRTILREICFPLDPAIIPPLRGWIIHKRMSIRMKKLCSLPLFFLGLPLFTSTGFAASYAAPSYDALDAFSTTLNPNGVWTFGRSTAVNGGTFTAFDDFVVDTVYDVWRDNEHLTLGTPSVWRRSDLGTLNFHPSSGGAFNPYTIIRFTAPASGSFNYSVMFPANSNGSRDVYIYHNTTSLYSNIIGSFQPESDSDILSLTIGDTVDVVVGPNGDYTNDSTEVSFSLTAVPEPTSALLFGMSTLALTMTRRRGFN